MARLHTFEAGHCTHPACMALKGAGLEGRCFPSRAWLIETSRGLHLWDTGYATHFRDATRGIYRLYPLVTPVHLDAQSPLVLQLRRQGLHSRDLQSIVISHFHADHMAGLKDFPTPRIVCSSDGWDSVQGLSGLRALRRAFLPGLMPADVQMRLQFVETLPQRPLPHDLSPFTLGADLDGSGEVLIVPLPGHAIGHLGAFVRLEQGWMLIASDAAWAKEGYQALRGPSELSFLIQHRRSDYYRTLHSLHALHVRGLPIVLTHEAPEQAP